MHPLIQDKLPELRELCRKNRVRTLSLFGSAATGGFDPDHSDVDLLVEFERIEEPGVLSGSFFGLLHGAEDLFERRIDLVCDRAIENPMFREIVDRTKVPLYAAA